jgi:hypothetical protein
MPELHHTARASYYAFDCPEGTWTARLDEKAVGSASNLRLFFSDFATGKKYLLFVFFTDRCRPRDGGFDFPNDGEPGDIFALITAKTEAGNPDLLSARKLIANH